MSEPRTKTFSEATALHLVDIAYTAIKVARGEWSGMVIPVSVDQASATALAEIEAAYEGLIDGEWGDSDGNA